MDHDEPALGMPHDGARRARLGGVVLFLAASALGTTPAAGWHPRLTPTGPPAAVEIHVVDAWGDDLVGASVEERGSRRRVLTNASGRAVLSGVECGRPHVFRVWMPGYVERVVRRRVPCGGGEEPATAIEACLDEEVGEVLFLECRRPMVDLGEVGTGTRLGGDFLADLPGSAGGSASPREQHPTIPPACPSPSRVDSAE